MNKPRVITDSAIADLEQMVPNFDLSNLGYAVHEFTYNSEDASADVVFTISLQHLKPDFKKYINQLQGSSTRKSKIYGDTPTSKTKIIRWLTGYREGANINDTQKAAAIKVVQLAGYDAIHPILKAIEEKYDCLAVSNFIGAKTQAKGQSIFEVMLFDSPGDAVSIIENEPTVIPVDGEPVSISVTPKPNKSKKTGGVKIKKLPAKKYGKNTKGSLHTLPRGFSRHVIPEDELKKIGEQIVFELTNGNSTTRLKMNANDCKTHYLATKEMSKNPNELTFMLSDDFYNNPAGPEKFYDGFELFGATARTKAMMTALMSTGNTELTTSGGRKTPKLGSKLAKDVRRKLQQEFASDEILIYAKIMPKLNPYSGKMSRHTGDIVYYIYFTDRRL